MYCEHLCLVCASCRTPCATFAFKCFCTTERNRPGSSVCVCVLVCVYNAFILDTSLNLAFGMKRGGHTEGRSHGSVFFFSSSYLVRCSSFLLFSFSSRKGSDRPSPSSTVKSNVFVCANSRHSRKSFCEKNLRWCEFTCFRTYATGGSRLPFRMLNHPGELVHNMGTRAIDIVAFRGNATLLVGRLLLLRTLV